jgi:membrane associated rhomboid family serine protease
MPIRDTVPSRYPPVATWSLIALNSLVFLYELSLAPEELERLVYLFGIVPARYTHLEWASWVGLPADDYWPFLTSMFLHAGWVHVVGSMWTLWILGDNVEDRMGSVRFILFYLLTGVLAGVAHSAIHADSTIPTVGASGAIAGVLGAYFLLFPRARIIAVLPVMFWPYFFEVPAVTYLLIWLYSQLFSGALAGLLSPDGGGVAWWAHVGGFVSGALFHRLFILPERSRPRRFQPDELGIDAAWARVW